MKEQLISFETAKLAKEKGFNILQHSYYFEDGEFKENSLKGTNGYYGEEYEFNLSEFNENWNDKWLTKKTGDRCFGCSKQKGYLETFSAPTQSLLQRWCREKHNKHIQITTDYYLDGINWNYQILWPDETFFDEEGTYDGGDVGNLAFEHFDGTGMYGDNGEYNTYEKALEAGLKHCLTLI